MLWTVFIGLVIGAIAKMLMPGHNLIGFVITMIIGVIGAVFAHYIGRGFGWFGESEAAGIIASIIGSIFLLSLYHTCTGPRRKNHNGR